ncbi:MAG TPA: hypothetical protein PKD63_04005 [Solirubrobacteraceae bacterium]|nr:hypothetical protein [Solirubrobacteraceae bacterium]
MHGRVVALLVGLAVLTSAGPVHAATFHAALPGTAGPGCPASSPCTIAAAIAAADAAPGADVVQVTGPVTLSGTADLSGSPIDLRGSGRGAGGTLLDGGGDPALLIGPQSSARDLRADATLAAPVRIAEGGTLAAADVRVLGGGAPAGVRVDGGAPTRESVIEDVTITQVTVTGDGNGIAVDGAADRTVVRDVTITGVGDGIVRSASGAATIVVQRTRLNVTGDGLDLRGTADLRMSSSVVRALPSVGDPTTAYFNALRLRDAVQADIRHVTLDGSANTGYRAGDPSHGLADGLDLADGATADVRAAAIVGVRTALECVGTSTGAITVRRSYYDGANPEASPTCTVTDAGGSLVQPGPSLAPFAGAATGDLHLVPGAPLVDAAGTEPPGPDESPTDPDGVARPSDGDRDGGIERDIGAFEVPGPAVAPAPAPEIPPVIAPGPAAAGPVAPPRAPPGPPPGRARRRLWSGCRGPCASPRAAPRVRASAAAHARAARCGSG